MDQSTRLEGAVVQPKSEQLFGCTSKTCRGGGGSTSFRLDPGEHDGRIGIAAPLSDPAPDGTLMKWRYSQFLLSGKCAKQKPQQSSPMLMLILMLMPMLMQCFFIDENQRCPPNQRFPFTLKHRAITETCQKNLWGKISPIIE